MAEDYFPHNRLDDARGYLADFLGDEECHGERSFGWFNELRSYIEGMSLNDPLIVESTKYLEPFLNDDERIDCAIYPNGEASKFLDRGWGGEFRAYLTRFVEALRLDHAKWERMVAEKGAAARWALDSE